MSVRDLSRGNTIRMHELNGVEVTAKVKNVYCLVHSRLGMTEWVADVEAIDRRSWTIDDSYDFYSLPDENGKTEKTLDNKTQGKTPTEIQRELRQLGVKGFVVKVAGSRVTMKVNENDIKKNRECLK